MLHTLLYFLALFSLSTSSNWAKLNHMPVEVLGFYRLGIASLLLGVWLFVVKKRKIPTFSKDSLWILVSGTFLFMHLWTFKYAAKNTSISNCMIIFSSNPIWASLGAVLFFKEKLSSRLVISYFLALIGVYVLVAPELQIGKTLNSGDLSAFVSAILYACYMLAGKRARLNFDNVIYSFGQYLVCALWFGLCALYTGAPMTGYDSVSWLAIAGLLALPTFFGHFSFTYLVEHMNISIMTCGKLIEPVIASIIAAIVFNEKLSPTAPTAFCLTATSVIILFGPNIYKQFRRQFE